MKKTAGLNILVVAAHPDDEVLGCGATIAKHVEEGSRVWILILGEGITSRVGLSDVQKRKGLEKLHKSAQKASKILGVSKLILEHLPDNKFDSIPLLEIVHKIEKVTSDYQPQIIYTHSRSDVNIDHRRTLEAVEAAVRPLPSSTIQSVLTFEVPSSTEWNFVRELFRPNVFNQIDEKVFAKKIKAISAYSQELKPFPHPRSLEYLKSLAKVRGVQAGFNLAEAFELIYLRKLD